MVTPYRPDEAGRFEPELPTAGPCQGRDGVACRVGPHDWRQRRTGPRFALRVARCRRHGLAFTLYPPGHVPYGRRLVAPVSPDGQLLDPGAEPGSLDRWRVTAFEAPIDLSEGSRWPRSWERKATDTRRPEYTTQWRWTRRLARLAGVAPALGEARHAVAGALGVATLVARERAEGVDGTRALASAIAAVLALVARPAALDGVLAAGVEAGLWGRVHRWDPTGRILRPITVPTGRTRAPP